MTALRIAGPVVLCLLLIYAPTIASEEREVAFACRGYEVTYPGNEQSARIEPEGTAEIVIEKEIINIRAGGPFLPSKLNILKEDKIEILFSKSYTSDAIYHGKFNLITLELALTKSSDTPPTWNAVYKCKFVKKVL
jgi:hypothetical protein